MHEDAIIKGVKLVAESLAVRQAPNSSTSQLLLLTDLNVFLFTAETYLWSPKKRHQDFCR